VFLDSQPVTPRFREAAESRLIRPTFRTRHPDNDHLGGHDQFRIQITVGKTGTGNSLFMFELRDPSEILDSPLIPVTGVPEPTAALQLLAGFGLLRSVAVRAKTHGPRNSFRPRRGSSIHGHPQIG
jgi:hypothetical protein